ncbi:MAG: hypothetical protein ACRDKW_05815 [Actinomycetota bacterium]
MTGRGVPVLWAAGTRLCNGRLVCEVSVNRHGFQIRPGPSVLNEQHLPPILSRRVATSALSRSGILPSVSMSIAGTWSTS